MTLKLAMALSIVLNKVSFVISKVQSISKFGRPSFPSTSNTLMKNFINISAFVRLSLVRVPFDISSSLKTRS